MKGKNPMDISTDTESIYKSQHSFMIKTVNKLRIEGNYFNIIKSVYEKLMANILHGRKQKAFSVRSNMTGIPTSATSVEHCIRSCSQSE